MGKDPKCVPYVKTGFSCPQTCLSIGWALLEKYRRFQKSTDASILTRAEWQILSAMDRYYGQILHPVEQILWADLNGRTEQVVTVKCHLFKLVTGLG